MNKRIATFAIVAGMVVAGGSPPFRARTGSTRTASAETNPSPALVQPSRALPTNHPSTSEPLISVHTMHTMDRLGTSAGCEANPSALRWWAGLELAKCAQSQSNATRHVSCSSPPAGRPRKIAELSVTRAGGTATANIGRWIGQFDGSATSARDEKNSARVPCDGRLGQGYLSGGE